MREREERHENSPGFIYLFFFFPFLFLSQVTGHAFCKSKYRRIRLKTVRSDHFRCAGQRHRNDELVAHHPARQKTPDRNRWSRSRILAELLAYIHTTLSLSLFLVFRFSSRDGVAAAAALVSPSQEGRVNGCSHNVTPFHGLAQKVLKRIRKKREKKTKKKKHSESLKRIVTCLVSMETEEKEKILLLLLSFSLSGYLITSLLFIYILYLKKAKKKESTGEREKWKNK